jgi:LmbE family N-acetylglucosaminyl deacetylase
MSGDPPALMAVFAHPDDETFLCGGTLALLARKGVRVQVLTATPGQAGSRGDPPLCRPDELAAMREQELRCACAALGIEPPLLLDYPDGHLSEADPERIVAEILMVAREVRPQVMLTFGPEGVSGHPDHIAIGRFAAEAFHRAEDVVALYARALPQTIAAMMGNPRIRPVPDESITLAVNVMPVWEAKLAAIRCHRTQLSGTPILSAPTDRQQMFLGREHFRRLAATGAGPCWREIQGLGDGNP